MPLLLLSMLLGGGMSSRLFQRVREELGLAYSVYTFQTFHADTGMHGVYVGTGAGDGAARRSTPIRDELRRVVDDGLAGRRARDGTQQLKGQVTLSLESVSSRMYRAASVELYGEPYRTLDETAGADRRDHARTTSPPCAREFFAPERQTVVSLGPKASRDRLTVVRAHCLWRRQLRTRRFLPSDHSR